MTAWTSDELGKNGAAEQLEIASPRHDGTLHKPVTVWGVRPGDDLYSGAGYVNAMVAPEARAATIRLVPRATT